MSVKVYRGSRVW